MQKSIIILIIVILIGAGIYFFMTQGSSDEPVVPETEDTTTDTTEPTDGDQTDQTGDAQEPGESVIGTSVEGRDITAYHYGTGETELLLVGGIHGGYAWNTSLVAYEAADYFNENPDAIPDNMRVTVIPVLNPDGLNKTIGTDGRFTKADVPSSQEAVTTGRFNANGVDLNRNFDCNWEPTGTWQERTVDGGSKAFSEPESLAFKNYVATHNPSATVVWYSAAGGVFASSCSTGILPETRTIMNVFADASGYPAYDEFNFYELTGDMANWLSRVGVPTVSILLSTHSDVEWSENKAGIMALLDHYAK